MSVFSGKTKIYKHGNMTSAWRYR